MTWYPVDIRVTDLKDRPDVLAVINGGALNKGLNFADCDHGEFRASDLARSSCRPVVSKNVCHGVV